MAETKIMCLYPRLIFNKKYTNTAKNGGNIPPINDIRTLYVPVGCQNCIECRKQKARHWQVRLLEDIKENTNGKFITFTFSNEEYAKLCKELNGLQGYVLDNAIATLAVRRFLGRWRKEYKKSIRHWLVTELGHNGTENIHLHGIVWPASTDAFKEIEKIWSYGFVWKGTEKHTKGGITEYINYVNEKTVSYITKYVQKQDEKHQYYKPIILSSPGIGSNYIKNRDSQNNKYKENETIETYRTNTGHKIGLPIYWRNKIYNDEEKEKLWLEKINKNIRYVRGEKIDISKGLNDYFAIVRWHREINKELKYGSDEIDYDQKEYEERLRIINQGTRIKKGYNNNKNNG